MEKIENTTQHGGKCLPGKGTGFPNPVSHAQAAEATPPVPGRTFRNADLAMGSSPNPHIPQKKDILVTRHMQTHADHANTLENVERG